MGEPAVSGYTKAETVRSEGDSQTALSGDALVVLADGTRLVPTAEPRRVADSNWELTTAAGRRIVRDTELWFSEAALPMPANDVKPPQPLPVVIMLPDRSRLEGSVLGIRDDNGVTWLRWSRYGRECEVRIADTAVARVEITLRAPGLPRATPATANNMQGVDSTAVDANAAVSVPGKLASIAHLIAPGFAELADATRLVSDAMPQQLSDGSWHLSVGGHTRIVPAHEAWVMETEMPAPKEMVKAGAPIPFCVALPAGGRLEGELIESRIGREEIWLHWRRGGRKRTLWLNAAGVAGFECVMRQPKQSLAAGSTAANGQADRLPLLRSAADLDAYLVAELQGDGHALKHHLLADSQAWERCGDDARNADTGFRLAQRLGLPLIDLAAVPAAEPALPALSPEMARKFRMVPLRVRQNLIAVATDNPTNQEAVSTVEFSTGRRVVLLFAKSGAVHAAISRYYDRVEDTALLKSLVLGPESDDDNGKSARENERLAHEQPIVRLVSTLIEDAARRRASDIHVRPRADDFEVLYRIDGALIPVRTFAKPLLRAVTSRIKVLAGMDIAEHRLPQDGRVSVPFEDTEIDMRISVLPSVNGESVVMRLLNPRDSLRSLTEIGFSPHDEALFRDMLARNHGMILVTGPTGCGKSTTLYAALLEARKEDVNIITVEDPVEYHISDVTQIQINHGIGFDFSRTLRNILRHDPDVIMLGEIRDHETAEIAVESALTGHLVLSTLHTNSAATAVTRLLDLGVESFLLSSTLLGVLAQRLARRNCRQCMEPERVDPFVRAALGVGEDETFYRGIGCSHCGSTGVHGRIAVYELMPVTPAIRKLIVPNVDGDAVHAQALAAGMVSITDQAIALARAGVISLDEAYRIRVE